MQALGVELALADGLPVERLLLGAVPTWVAEEGDAREFFVQAWLRRLLFPGHRLVIEESAESPATGSVAALVTALSVGRTAVVVRERRSARGFEAAAELRAAAAAATILRDSLGDGSLYGDAADLADRTAAAANVTLEGLASSARPAARRPSGSAVPQSSSGISGRAAAPRCSGRWASRGSFGRVGRC
jgi:hypothetical protein